MSTRSSATAASTPAIPWATSASIPRTTWKRRGTVTSRTSSCSAGTSSRACAPCSGAPATGGSSAVTSRSGSRPEPDDEHAEETDQNEVADEDPPREHLAPVLDRAVALREAVELRMREREDGDEHGRGGETSRRNERDEPGRVLRRQHLVEGHER